MAGIANPPSASRLPPDLSQSARGHDGNHDNNPKDGSNWELLCIDCHENEHAKLLDAAAGAGGSGPAVNGANFNPFADLAERMKKKGS